MIRSSFKQQVGVTDPQEISRLKMLAIVGVQNYVVYEQTGCDALTRHHSMHVGLAPNPRRVVRAQESDGEAWEWSGTCWQKRLRHRNQRVRTLISVFPRSSDAMRQFLCANRWDQITLMSSQGPRLQSTLRSSRLALQSQLCAVS